MSSKSTTTVEKEDCLSCRLVSGFGIMGVGGYLYVHSNNRGKIQMGAMRILAACAFGLGIARLLNMDFLKSKQKDR